MCKKVENTKRIYFKNNIDMIRKKILREHEFYIYKYQKLLRKEEQSNNLFLKAFFRRRKNILGAKLGIYIPENVFEKELHIWHYGSIIVNQGSKVGKNCILHGMNCIGNNGINNVCPVIGNNVDIGIGAKIIGNVYIADGVKIGSGAIVVNSCYEKNATMVGIPARIITKVKNGMDESYASK